VYVLKIAAIDIGSNAIRLQVSNTLTFNQTIVFKKIEYVRFPLRLGQDVFSTGRISEERKAKFKKLMRSFKLLLELYEVDYYMACATSAMRESANGPQIVKEVEEEIGLKIKVIDGNKEALLINNAIASFLSDKTYLHIDVGGGSTELNIYVGGQKIASRSFKIGSVRRMDHHDSPTIWKTMQKWIEENIKREYGPVISVGTGGNINKIFELARKKPGKSMSLKKVKEVQQMVAGYTVEERINVLQMNPDRADVIIPASDIYIAVMEWAKSRSIIVPDVGLKDGILLHLYSKHTDSELPIAKKH
jgi:exopolyphosphatase / guanosine-5'-triphosphate,3'-diphosphate pyrophosphatase